MEDISINLYCIDFFIVIKKNCKKLAKTDLYKKKEMQRCDKSNRYHQD